MPTKIARRNLPQMFLKAREAMLCYFRPIITHFGLTEQQWRIIRVISERERLEPREICELCHILSPSLAGVLARMEQTGLVSRRRMAEDQRRVLVELTPKSEEIVRAMAPLIEEQYLYIEEALGTDLIDQLHTVLDQVAGAKCSGIRRVALPARGDTEGHR